MDLARLISERRTPVARLLRRLKCARISARAKQRTLLALLPVWLATRWFTDGFGFHLLGLVIVATGASLLRKERAFLVTMLVAMVDSEGVLYHPGAWPSFFVRTFFLFATVLTVDYFRSLAVTCEVEELQPLQAAAASPESSALLDESAWEHRYTLEEVSASLIALCRQVANFHTLLYLVYDPRGKALRGMVRISHSENIPDPLTIPLGAGHVGRLAMKQEFQYLNRFTQDWRTLHYYTAAETIGSLLVVPATHQGQLTGALVLDSKSPDGFSATQVTVIRALAAAFDQLWHLSATETDYQDHLRKYRLLLEVQSRLTAACDDLPATEAVLLEYVKQLVPADSHTIYFPDSPDSFVLLNDRARFIVNCVQWVTKRGQALRIGNARQEHQLLVGIRTDQFRNDFHSVLAVPVVSGETVLAVIVAEGRRTNQFGAVEEEALRILAGQAGAALATARRNALAARREAHAVALLKAQAELVRSLDYREAMRGLLDAFSLVFPHQYLLFYRMEGGRPKLAVGRDWEGDLPKHLLRCRALRRVAVTGQMMEIEDIYTSTQPVESRPGVRSLLLVPLVRGKRTIGIVEMGHRAVGGFRTIEFSLLEQLQATAARWWAAVEEFRQLDADLVTDEVTGLGNGRFLAGYLRQAAQKLAAGELRSLALLAVKVNRLVEHQYRLGPGEWDRALKRVGTVITGSLAAPNRLVRRRDNEFLVLIPDLGTDEAATVAAEIRAAIDREPLYCRGERLGNLNARIGIAWGDAASSPERILLRAEEALACAQREGGDGICAFVA